MSRYLSPLRYPGGKASIAPALLEDVDAEVWFEPFSGGAGVGLRALFDGVVEELWLAESDPVVRGLWEWIIDDAESLAEAVERLRPDLDLFYRSRQIIAGGTSEVRDLVLAGLVVNRCSHSGIIAGNVGPIGGALQNGRYTVAARFDPDALARRIRLLSPLASRMRMVGDDGIEALESLAVTGADDDVVVFADPPYLGVGDRLYRDRMGLDAHRRLAAALSDLRCEWMLTVGDVDEVRDLYDFAEVGRVPVRYCGSSSRIAEELLIRPSLSAADRNHRTRRRHERNHLRHISRRTGCRGSVDDPASADRR